MKKIFKHLLIAILIGIDPVSAMAKEDHKDEAGEIELSVKAIQNYGITSNIFKITEGQITLPRSAVVVSKDEFFIYEKEGEHFKQVEVHPTNHVNGTVVFAPEHDDEEHEIVTTGASYLRIVFLSNANPEAGHSH